MATITTCKCRITHQLAKEPKVDMGRQGAENMRKQANWKLQWGAECLDRHVRFREKGGGLNPAPLLDLSRFPYFSQKHLVWNIEGFTEAFSHIERNIAYSTFHIGNHVLADTKSFCQFCLRYVFLAAQAT